MRGRCGAINLARHRTRCPRERDRISLGLALASALGVAAAYRGGHARWVAALLVALQLALVGSLLGWVLGCTLIVCGWMLLGLCCTLLVNQRRDLALRAATLLGLSGIVLTLLAALA